MRRLLSIAILSLAVTTTVTFAADNALGTWKLNLEKTKSSPAPNPVKILIVTREASDGAVKVTVKGERADGAVINASYTAIYGGVEVPVTGNAPYDMVLLKQTDADTFTEKRRKAGGSYKTSGITVISDGGKVMTVTVRGTNTDGSPLAAVCVLDKQ
jgi:hypothetical protein